LKDQITIGLHLIFRRLASFGLLLFRQRESFANVGENIALEQEGVILKLELHVVTLHGLLLHCRAGRQLKQGEKQQWIER